MSRKNKNVLITGGSGFIGKHLTNILLAKGYNVSIFDRNPKNIQKDVKIFNGDVRNQKEIQNAMRKVDMVYHLAGLLGTEELNAKAVLATEVNVIGTINVFNAALKSNAKVLLVSKPNVWINTYSITKEASEKFSQMYQKEFGLKVATVKWFSVYGPGQKHYGVQKAVPTFIVKALKNEPIPIFDNGLQEADFIYTSDAVQATVLVAENPHLEGKIVEIGTGKGTSVLKLAKTIIRLASSDSKLEFLPMRGGEDPGTKVVANTKILKTMGFKPKVSLEEGLKETIKFYRRVVEEVN